MSAKKTALMQLIDWAKKEKAFSTHGRHMIIEKMKTLLPTDRSQIEEAYVAGSFFKSNSSMTTTRQRKRRSSEYFTNNYETP